MSADTELLNRLKLVLTPGLGPVLAQRAIRTLGSIDALLAANESALRSVKGIGEEKARSISAGLAGSAALADKEAAQAREMGIQLVPLGDPRYPPLLAEIPNPPMVIYVRGQVGTMGAERYGAAIVGSRECSSYGLEQAARFASAFAQAGLNVVSGGARGIDTAAHRAALLNARVGGRTIAVLGCGLAQTYPPENTRLFAEIVQQDAGCIVSELPLNTPPNAENFPARNRIISGLSLGVVIIEAARRSGALITGRIALEEHNREVFVVPGRVDSPFSQGGLELLKAGGAGIVTHPDDVIAALKAPARHQHAGTHGALYGNPALFEKESPVPESTAEPRSNKPAPSDPGAHPGSLELDQSLTAQQRAVLSALESALTLDEVLARIGGEPASVRADVSLLEIKRRVKRRGSRFERTR
jgi:DNA processing protein